MVELLGVGVSRLMDNVFAARCVPNDGPIYKAVESRKLKRITKTHAPVALFYYGGGAGGSIGFSVRYQGELLGI